MKIPILTTTLWNTVFLLLLAGILNGIVYNYFLYWLAWISLVPFFIAIESKNSKIAFLKGGTVGLITSFFLYGWMFEATQKFTASETLLGIPLILFSSLYFAVWWGVFASIFNWYRKKSSNHSYIYQLLFGASLCTLLEFARHSVLKGLPWFHHTIAYTQSPAPIFIQISSITGIWGITFFILIINMLFYFAIITKRKKLLVLAFAVLGVYSIIGFSLLHMDLDRGKELKFVLLQENINAETRWLPETGDSLAGIYASLAEKAVLENPDYIIWSEGSIPWEFRADDDLLKMVLNKTTSTGATHFVGAIYPTNNGKFYNSVLQVEADGKITGRYDKRTLLTFIEEPLSNAKIFNSLKLDFFSRGIHENIVHGTRSPLLQSKGVIFETLICNESLHPISSTAEGESIIIALNNDAWMTDSMLPYHHFYTAAIRATENNKYVIVNSNKGFSGIIDNRGRVIKKEFSEKEQIISGIAYPYSKGSIYSEYKDIPTIALLAIVLIMLLFKNRRRAQ